MIGGVAATTQPSISQTTTKATPKYPRTITFKEPKTSKKKAKRASIK